MPSKYARQALKETPIEIREQAIKYGNDMKNYDKMKKAELIAELLKKESPIVNNNLSNSTITVNPNKGKDSKTLNTLSEAILSIAKTIENRGSQPVYGVYMSSKGIKKGK